MSSTDEVLKRITRRCSNEGSEEKHRHVHLIQGRAKAAQVYPKDLAVCICEGIAAQKRLQDLGLKARNVLSLEEMNSVTKSKSDECPSASLHQTGYEGMEAYDDLSGQALEPALMMQARKDEIECFKEMGVYEKVDVKEWLNNYIMTHQF